MSNPGRWAIQRAQAEALVLENEYTAGNTPSTPQDKLVVVSGCSAGGKSTLLSEMASRGYFVCPEPGRQIVKEELYIGGDGLPWENPRRFIELCLSRAMYFYNTARPGAKPALFDRSIVDAASALLQLGPLPSHYQRALERYRYATRVFLVPPWEALFAHDAERQHSFAAAVVEYERLLHSYPENGYDVVVIPKLSVAQRADFLEEQLKG